MNVFNRIAMVLIFLLLIVFLTAAFIFPAEALDPLANLAAWGDYFNRMYYVQQPWTRLVGIGLALVVDVLLLFLIFLEVRPRRKRFIRVQQVSGGMATVNVDSVRQQIQYRLDPMEGVLRVNPRIRSKGDKVQTRVDVDVMRGVAVPQMADHLINAVNQVLTQDLGLQIAGKPEVRIKVVPLPDARTGPAPTPSPEVAEKEAPPPLPAEPVAEPMTAPAEEEMPPLPPAEASMGDVRIFEDMEMGGEEEEEEEEATYEVPDWGE